MFGLISTKPAVIYFGTGSGVDCDLVTLSPLSLSVANLLVKVALKMRYFLNQWIFNPLEYFDISRPNLIDYINIANFLG